MFGNDRGDRERVDPVRAPLEQRFAGVLERLEAAHRGSRRRRRPGRTPARSPARRPPAPDRAAATIICANRSMRLACLRSIHCVGSKSFASQANVTGNPVVSNAVIGPAVALPATSFSQLDRTSLPSGVTAPSPVITTLRRPLAPIDLDVPRSPVRRRTEGHLVRESALEADIARRSVFVDDDPHRDAAGRADRRAIVIGVGPARPRPRGHPSSQAVSSTSPPRAD